MQTVTFRELIDGVADLMQVSSDADGSAPFGDLLSEDVLPLTRTVARLVREAWDFYPWGELAEISVAAYRPTWTAVDTYAEDDEVYFDAVAGEEGYYTALGATTAGQSPVTNPELWEELVLERKVLDKVEYSIGRVLDVFAADPTDVDSERAPRVAFVIRSDGVQVAESAPATVWVEHMPEPPTLVGAAYDAAATYATGDTVLFESTDYLTALGATTAGQSPTTNPELWELQEIPGWFREFVVNRAYAFTQRRDGAADQAMVSEEMGWLGLYRAIDQIEGQSGQVRRMRVAARR